MKHLNFLLISMILSVACYAQSPAPITGASSTCVGVATPYSDATIGGTWSAAVTAIAYIDPVTGVLTGVAAGTTTISYEAPSLAYTTTVVTINPLPCPITGITAICLGSSTSLSDCLTGGVWSCSTLTIATVGGAGAVYGVASGSTTISYTDALGCSTTASITVSAGPAVFTVTGGGSFCAGGSGVDVSLSGSSTGVEYQLYLGGIAIGAAVAGTGSPINFGMMTAAGVYTVTASTGSGCTATMAGSATIVVNPLPTAYAVTGGGAYCSGGAGEHIGLAGSDAGINYQVYNGITIVGSPVAGTGTSLDFGLFTGGGGTYTVMATNPVTDCSADMLGSDTISVNPLPTAYTVTGGGSYCAGGAGMDVGLSNSDFGVNYQLYASGSPAGSPVAGTGSSLDFGMETTVGTYTVIATNATTGCTNTMTGSIAIATTAPPTVTASASSVACDGSYTLTGSGATSYTWAPGTGLSCTGCASPTCTPTATTTYTVMGTDGSGCTGTATVSVDGNRIMGTITPTVSGTIEVWLVQFDPSDSSISALDSMVACTSGGSQYYNFADPAIGNYMVKAYLEGGTPGTSGYIPTYGASSAHWYAATGITHSSATDNMNIDMIYGTVPSGPGFISGFVASGAGRGTTLSAPVAGMLIYLTDASGNVLTYTQTNSTGNYSFGSLENGIYIIYPEVYQYNTTASATITLSSSSESVSNINFKQLTASKTITPFDYTEVKPITVTEGISIYPNPATSDLSISWNNQSTGSAAVVITDVTGREVYKTAININAASGTAQIGLQGMRDGIYLLTIKNESINYCTELMVNY